MLVEHVSFAVALCQNKITLEFLKEGPPFAAESLHHTADFPNLAAFGNRLEMRRPLWVTTLRIRRLVTAIYKISRSRMMKTYAEGL